MQTAVLKPGELAAMLPLEAHANATRCAPEKAGAAWFIAAKQAFPPRHVAAGRGR